MPADKVDQTMCAVGDELGTYVNSRASVGFSRVELSNTSSKPAFETRSPGSRLNLCFPMAVEVGESMMQHQGTMMAISERSNIIVPVQVANSPFVMGLGLIRSHDKISPNMASLESSALAVSASAIL